jgi:hypothetical protein
MKRFYIFNHYFHTISYIRLCLCILTLKNVYICNIRFRRNNDTILLQINKWVDIIFMYYFGILYTKNRKNEYPCLNDLLHIR